MGEWLSENQWPWNKLAQLRHLVMVVALWSVSTGYLLVNAFVQIADSATI